MACLVMALRIEEERKMKKYIVMAMFVMVNVMAQTPLGTEITYQGELKDNLDNPLTGQYDFKFVAFDTLNDGTGNLLGTVILDNVQVTNGVFTTQLDLGSGIFIGDKVWLEINVRVGTSTGGFTQLLPRQQVTATPYATHAQFVGADAISDLEIQDGSITAADLGVDSVGASEISANAVGTSEIDSAQVQRRVTGSCAAGDFITSVNEDGTVTCVTENVGLTTVTSAEIVDGTIIAADVNTTQIQKRVTGSCSAGQYIKTVNQDGTVVCQADATGLTTVTSADIVDATIQTVDLGNGSVNIGKLAANSVDSSKVVDESLTAADLAPNSVAASEIAANAVGSSEIATNAVGISEIISTQVHRRAVGACLYPEYVTSIAENGDLICARMPVGVGFTLDSTDNVGSHTSIAIGADNNPIISYRDSTNFSLKVVKCTNQNCSSANTPLTLDFTDSIGNDSVGYYTSIAIGADNNPIISYYDVTYGDLKVVKCTNQSCSSTNTLLTLDSTGNVGSYTSIAIGADNNPIISYRDVTNGDLKVVKCTNQSCSSTNTPLTLDSTGSVGAYTSIAIGADNNPIISYYDVTNGDLKVVKCTNQSCSSSNTPLTLDSTGFVGVDTSIAIGVDNNPIISYLDDSNGDLKVVKCTNEYCSSANAPVTLDSTGVVGNYTSIAIGADNNPVISYLDTTNADLKLLKCTNQSCSFAVPVTLDSTGAVGGYTSIAIGSDNNPIISYYDFTNGDLKVYSCGDEACKQ